MKKTRLKTQIWLYFAVFAVAILSVLWGMQLIAFDYFYYEKETEKVEALGELVVHRWRNVRFSQPVSIKFYQDEVQVRIFNSAGVKESSGVLELSEPDPLDENLFIRKFEAAGQERYIERITDQSVPNSNFLICGAKVENEEHPEYSLYVYIINPMGQLDSVSAILQEQLLLLSVLIVLLALVISYFISSRIARPIMVITEKAGQLAKGDYEVEFQNHDFLEISQLTDALNHATKELARTDQMKSDLLANVSHDLRTPLTMIKAYAELIRDLSGDDPVRREEHVDVIIQEADWMSAMITDILEYSRIQSGNMYYEMSEFDLSSLTRECVRHFQPAAGRSGGVRIFWEGSEHLMVWGDMSRIQRVINNLISNAVKHSPEGGQVDVSLWRNGTAVRWQVKDYGSGIPPESLERIWEQYFTQSGTSGRMSGGTGLGLSIVRGILEDHGARYGVFSEPGKGTRFWFELESRGEIFC